VEVAFECTAELFIGFERVIELNIEAVKTSIFEQQALADAVLSARSPAQLIDLQSQQLPATVKKTFAYWRHVEDIVVETGNRFLTAIYAAMQFVSTQASELDE
jgi:phasin family protein